MKILVIDDNALLARCLAGRLRRHDVTVETDPTAGLARLIRADLDGEPFDVVLCDFSMPTMNGSGVLAGLHVLRDRPIFILMTGYDNAVEGALAADGVLLKPFTPTDVDILLSRIKLTRSREETLPLRVMPLAQGT